MAKALTIRVVPDLFLSSLQTRPRADNRRAREQSPLPPSPIVEKKGVKLRPPILGANRSTKRKKPESKDAPPAYPKDVKFNPKRLASIWGWRRSRQIQAIKADLANAKFNAEPCFNFLPASLPGTPPPEYEPARAQSRRSSLSVRFKEPEAVPARPQMQRASSVPASISAVTTSASLTAEISAAAARAREADAQGVPVKAWTPAAITMALLWVVCFGTLLAPVPEWLKCAYFILLVSGHCYRLLHLEMAPDRGPPYPYI